MEDIMDRNTRLLAQANAVLRAQEEEASAQGLRNAIDEINRHLGSALRLGQPQATPVPPPPLPGYIVNPNTVSLAEVRNVIDPAVLPKPSGQGRRQYVELVELGPVVAHPTPYTQNLQLTRVYGLPIVVGKGEFVDGDIAIYVPLGSQLPPREQFAFIHQNKNYIVQTRRFRGVESCGVLLPPSEFFRLRDYATGGYSHATPNCWNVWLEHVVGADVSGWLGIGNPR